MNTSTFFAPRRMQYWHRVGYGLGLAIVLSATMLWPAPAAATNHSSVISEAYLETQRATITLLEQIIVLQQRAIETENYGLLPQIDQLRQNVQALQNVLEQRAATHGQSLDDAVLPADETDTSVPQDTETDSDTSVPTDSADSDSDEYRAYTTLEQEEIIEEELNTLDPDFPREEFMVCGESGGLMFGGTKTLPIPDGTVALENGEFQCIDGLWTPELAPTAGQRENRTFDFGSGGDCEAFDGTMYPEGIEATVRYETIFFQFRAECRNGAFDVTIIDNQN